MLKQVAILKTVTGHCVVSEYFKYLHTQLTLILDLQILDLQNWLDLRTTSSIHLKEILLLKKKKKEGELLRSSICWTFKINVADVHHELLTRLFFFFFFSYPQTTVNNPLPPHLAKQDEIIKPFTTTTGETHDYKYHGGILANDQHKKAPGHWNIHHNKDLREKVNYINKCRDFFI